eukprot:COSAG01_NODE_44634_length_417_cov_0.654088_1_plen_36_part_01
MGCCGGKEAAAKSFGNVMYGSEDSNASYTSMDEGAA